MKKMWTTFQPFQPRRGLQTSGHGLADRSLVNVPDIDLSWRKYLAGESCTDPKAQGNNSKWKANSTADITSIVRRHWYMYSVWLYRGKGGVANE